MNNELFTFTTKWRRHPADPFITETVEAEDFETVFENLIDEINSQGADEDRVHYEIVGDNGHVWIISVNGRCKVRGW